MTAERFRMDVISKNIANANSMRVGNQEPYRRRDVVLAGGDDGIEIRRVVQDPRPFQRKFDPANPEADNRGFVETSNVEPIEEMVNMISASRSYEANIAAFNTARSMVRTALTIGRGA
jgi:flagellar basal-body rod protein FlgC